MPRDDGVSDDTVTMIEDYIAEILAARSETIEIDAFIVGQWRRGHISQAQMDDLLDRQDRIRLGIKRGHDFGKKVRKNPGIY